jgi:hypothetical protein
LVDLINALCVGVEDMPQLRLDQLFGFGDVVLFDWEDQFPVCVGIFFLGGVGGRAGWVALCRGGFAAAGGDPV